MIKTVFNDMKEFLEEARLDKEKNQINRCIVRMSGVFRTSSLGPDIQMVSLVAGYIVEGRLVELSIYCGDDWGKGFHQSEETHHRLKEKSDELRRKLSELELEVRSGCFQVLKA